VYNVVYLVEPIDFQLYWKKYKAPEDVPNTDGIYLVMSELDEESQTILDIGQTIEGGDRLSNHKRRPCWTESKVLGEPFLRYKFAEMPTSKHSESHRRAAECCLRFHVSKKVKLCGEECNKKYGREESVIIINSGSYKPLEPEYTCEGVPKIE